MVQSSQLLRSIQEAEKPPLPNILLLFSQPGEKKNFSVPPSTISHPTANIIHYFINFFKTEKKIEETYDCDKLDAANNSLMRMAAHSCRNPNWTNTTLSP